MSLDLTSPAPNYPYVRIGYKAGMSTTYNNKSDHTDGLDKQTETGNYEFADVPITGALKRFSRWLDIKSRGRDIVEFGNFPNQKEYNELARDLKNIFSSELKMWAEKKGASLKKLTKI
jgi:hypothetical protein